MKKLAIFYRDRDNQQAINYIADNFYQILGDYVSVTNYYTNELTPTEKIYADAYLVCYEEMLSNLVGHIENFSNVIVMKRSIKEKYLTPIKELPPGDKVLIVNDSKESTLQTMYMILELGVGHLKLFPYEEEMAKSGRYDDIYTAVVTQGSEHLVPKHISRVYNIQNREVSFETFHRVISLLDLKSQHIYNNLLRKAQNDLDTSTNYINSYFSNLLKDQLFSNIIEESSRAIILLDSLDNIHYINETAYSLFKLDQGEKFLQEKFLPEALVTASDFKGEVVSYNDNNYLVDKLDVRLMNNSIGCCLILHTEKDLRDNESSLSKHLKKNGFYAKYTFNDIIHHSLSMRNCINTAKTAAASNYTILIRGESGTGKELMAQSIHNYSSRKNHPFVAVNCAAIPESLLESELFGYDEGSFTGAKKNGKIGLFEHAQHGTIFLDEIGDISPAIQASLLRVLQEKQIMRVGSGKIINVDTRIIAATNADLEKKVRDGKFRKDLFYRLNVITINISPLKERKDDIMPLLKVFLGKQYDNLYPNEKEILTKYDWPGNVRELENVASYYKILNRLPDFTDMDVSSEHTDERAFSLMKDELDSHEPAEDIELTLLKIIAQNSSEFKGIGRGTVQQKLSELNISMGEGLLKKYMAKLKDDGLIYSKSGRGGSHITKEGLEFIKNN